MFPLDLYAGETARRIELDNPTKAAQYRARWLRDRELARAARLRAAVGWLGDRCVQLGERLRAWAAADVAAQVEPT